MREMHQIQIFRIQNLEKFRLLVGRIMRRIDAHRPKILRRCDEILEFLGIQKHDEFIFLIESRESANQFESVTTDAGETTRIHPSVNPDFHPRDFTDKCRITRTLFLLDWEKIAETKNYTDTN